MKIQVLGSAAAEAIPALWCECPFCEHAAKLGGKELRRRTAYCIDRDTLVDFGPDIHWQTTAFHVPLTEIRNLLITHAHQDHLDAVELIWRGGYFSRVTHPVKLIGSRPSLGRALAALAEDRGVTGFEEALLEPMTASPGKWIQLDNLEILPLEAAHAPGLAALLYLVSRDGRNVLFANDTGTVPDSTLRLIGERKLDVVFMDSTMGTGPDNPCHMNFDAVVRFKQKLAALELLAPGARCIANHFSHNGMIHHDELVARFLPHGIEVAYDGMELPLRSECLR